MARPKCRFPLNVNSGRITLSRYAGLHRLARLLSINAEYRAATGNMDEAVRSIRLGYKLSESLKDEPSLSAYQSRLALINIASKSLQRSLDYGDVSESQARRLYDLIADIDLYPGFEKAITGDRAVAIYRFEYIKVHGSSILNDVIQSCRGLTRLEWELPGTYIGRPYLYALELKMFSIMDREIVRSTVPYRKLDHPSPKLESTRPSVWAVVSSENVICDRVRWLCEMTKTKQAGSQIMLALAAYKDRFGAYPETLAELKSKLGWKLPGDPFSGKDFLYKRQGNGYLLYSVGENLKDDSGPEKRTEVGKADIIWRMER